MSQNEKADAGSRQSQKDQKIINDTMLSRLRQYQFLTENQETLEILKGLGANAWPFNSVVDGLKIVLDRDPFALELFYKSSKKLTENNIDFLTIEHDGTFQEYLDKQKAEHDMEPLEFLSLWCEAMEFEIETEDIIEGCIGWTADELLDINFPEVKYAVPGILPEGLSIIGGKPKMGKSILATNIGLSVALGGKALGYVDVDRGSVLYLALEDTGKRLQSRIKQMIQSDPGARERLKNFYLFTTWPKMGNGGLEALKKKIRSLPSLNLFIVDTLQAFRPNTKVKNNAYEIDYETISTIKNKVADKFEVPGLLVHHLRKMGAMDVFDTFSGTFGITGAADNLLVLSKKGKHSELAIRGRDIEETSFALKMDSRHLSWNIIGKADEVQSTNNQQAVYDCLKESCKVLTLKDIENRTGVKYKYIIKIMNKLVEQYPQIIKVGRGEYIFNNNLGDKGDFGDKGDIGDFGDKV